MNSVTSWLNLDDLEISLTRKFTSELIRIQLMASVMLFKVVKLTSILKSQCEDVSHYSFDGVNFWKKSVVDGRVFVVVYQDQFFGFRLRTMTCTPLSQTWKSLRIIESPNLIFKSRYSIVAWSWSFSQIPSTEGFEKPNPFWSNFCVL